jgi:hypothetical protein
MKSKSYYLILMQKRMMKKRFWGKGKIKKINKANRRKWY